MSAAESPKPRQGVSPWADAWRRLRKNVMAMGGLVVVIVMGILCAGAQLIAPYDATYGFTWIGAQAPLYEHVYVNNKNLLAMGEIPEVPPEYRQARRLVLDVTEDEVVEYRVTVRRRKVYSIRRVQGAVPVDTLQAGPGQQLRQVRDDKTLSEPLPPLVLEKKKRPPGVFSGQRVIQLHLVTPAKQVHYEAELSQGEASTFDPNGNEVKVQAVIVTELTRNGEPIERAEIDGRDVARVAADGVEQVASHLLGTDNSGRDLWSRVLYGGQISLMIGIVATIVSLLIGVVYGAISGYAGGRTDLLMMGAVDVLYGIPYMFLVILLMALFERSLLMLFVALGAVQWLTMARIVRGQVLSLKQKEFVEAARMSGSSPGSILFRHLVPNTLGVVVVYTTLTVPAVILQESFLAFIGLTVQSGGQSLDSWGALVNTGMRSLGSDGSSSWLLIWPSLAMAVTLFSLNFLGDGLRDALDPQQRGRT